MVPVPEFTDPEFATRATAATMGCYIFASLTDWSGIHASMITCAVTALSTIDSQIFKQRLRIFGAAFGGVLGVLSVVFLIPNMNNLTGVLIIIAVGTAISAWVTMGRQKFSYFGLQIALALAFSMTVLQEPHATSKLDDIRDRMVGIFLGIIAMRFAFVSLRHLGAASRLVYDRRG
jgi:multidrug resistance protein MdtO